MPKTLEITPITKREALSAQIVRHLLAAVRGGELQPGDRLPAERSLAEQLGVGRPTLREALRALQLLGVLDIRHGGGVFVADSEPDGLLGPAHLLLNPDEHDLDTILEARKVIEGALLAFVARTIDDEHIERLEANLAKFEALLDEVDDANVDKARLHELAQEFRAIIEAAVDNPILIRAVKNLDALSRATRDRLFATGSLEQLLINHRRMVQALIWHDPVAAQQALEEHVDYLRGTVGSEMPRRGKARA